MKKLANQVQTAKGLQIRRFFHQGRVLILLTTSSGK